MTLKEYFRINIKQICNINRNYLFLYTFVNKIKEETVYITKYYFTMEERSKFLRCMENGTFPSVPHFLKYNNKIDLQTLCSIFGTNTLSSMRFLHELNEDDCINYLNALITNKLIYRGNHGYCLFDNRDFVERANKIIQTNTNEPTKVINKQYFNQSDGNDYKLKLMNVGQACCSFLSKNNKLISVFDLGNRNNKNNYIYKAIKKIDKNPYFENVYVVISHFHDDHINMIKNIPSHSFNNLNFIIPFYENDVLKNLKIGEKLFLVCILLSKCKKTIVKGHLDLGFLEIYQGSRLKDPNDKSIINSMGIISYITSTNNKLLIPGDSLYLNWNHRFDVTHFIIPHHGCDYNGMILQNINEETVEKAFVFSKCNLKYYHPNMSHLNHFHYVERFDYGYKKDKNNKTHYNVFDGKEKVMDSKSKLIKNNFYREWKLVF